ncbi:MAG: NTP transferase domain-containing protein [Alphaproteobacteria bacterium]
MRAAILAAGVGRRLGPRAEAEPKVLLSFGGRSLLERHLNALHAIGVTEVAIGVGFEACRVRAELGRLRLPPSMAVSTVLNPDFTRGSVVTLWSLRAFLTRGGDVLVMDGDVLYDRHILGRLAETRHRNCFLIDPSHALDDETMKLALKDGAPVDFRKRIERPFDRCAESVGFFRLTETVAAKLVEAAKALIDRGDADDYFEEALREVLLAEPPGTFGAEDVAGLPWIEIDFPEDVIRAEREILPALPAEDR